MCLLSVTPCPRDVVDEATQVEVDTREELGIMLGGVGCVLELSRAGRRCWGWGVVNLLRCPEEPFVVVECW